MLGFFCAVFIQKKSPVNSETLLVVELKLTRPMARLP